MKEAQRKSSGQSKDKLKPIPGATRVWEIITMNIVDSVRQSGNGDRYTLKKNGCLVPQIILFNRFFLFVRKTNSTNYLQ